jgi:molecular chaperone DnaK
MSQTDIDKAVKDAEKFAEEDKAKKELVDHKTTADANIFAIEKLVRDTGDKISEEDKKTLTEACEELKKVKDMTDLAEVKKSLDEFSRQTSAIVTKLYQQSGAGANPNPGDKSGGADETIVE